MGAWLWWAWLQIWPNLVASLICFTVHHLLIRRHITREHEKTRKAVS